MTSLVVLVELDYRCMQLKVWEALLAWLSEWKKTTKWDKQPPYCSDTSLSFPCSPGITAVRMSVGPFALPDVSRQEEAACLSSIRTSDSHSDSLSHLPFLGSLSVSPSSLHNPNGPRRRTWTRRHRRSFRWESEPSRSGRRIQICLLDIS